MKKIALTFIATVVVAVATKGQDTTVYLPALETGQIWTEVRGDFEYASSAWITMDSMVTVVDNVEYYGFSLYELTHIGSFSGRTGGTYYMRQNDNHSKVYLIGESYEYENPDFTYERLVYDMDLNVGDTMYYYRMPMVVDSVYTQDGRKHVRFNYRISNYDMLEYVSPEFDVPLEFVEGIGPNWGWLWGDWDDYEGIPSLLLCVWRDGEQVNEGIAELYESHLRHDGFYPCTYNSYDGKIDDLSQVGYKVYPNPVEKVLTIAGLPEKKATVAVYDMLGNRLMGVECMGPEAEIDLSHLPSQLLLVSVLTDEGCSTYKVVKL